MKAKVSNKMATSLRLMGAGMFCLFSDVTVSLAAEAEHGDPGSGGLPQFDPSTYSSQIFWLTITFVFLYFYFSNKTLPEISSVLENRQEHIQGDLATAELLRREAEEAQAKYETLLENARNEATLAVVTATEAVKNKAATNHLEFREHSAKQVDNAEKRLIESKNDAMKDMNKVAAEVAREAAEKLVGIKADLKQAQNVVQTLNAKEAA